MNARRLSMLVLLAVAACRGEGCPTTALLEPVPALELCEFDDTAFSKPRGNATLEVGRMVNGAFVPLTEGEEVEIAPVPRDTMRLWYTLVALRITAPTELPGTLCAQIDGDILFTQDPLDEEVPDGVSFRRAADGSLVSERVPMFLGNRLATESGFDPVKTTSATLNLGGQAPTATELLFLGEGARGLAVKPINREGFLSTPAARPDSGLPSSVAFELQLQATPLFLRPGETSNVELRLYGERLGQDVTLSVEGLPAGVTLALGRTVIPGSDSAAAAELTSGRLEVPSSAAPGPFTLTVVASAGSFSRRASLELQVVPGSTTPTVALSVSPASLQLAPGETGEVVVRVVPFGGIQGTLFLKALADTDLEITTVPESVSLAAASDVRVRVKLVRSPFPGSMNTFSLVGVSGRSSWPVMQAVRVTTLAPASPSVFVTSPVRGRRVVQANVPLDWDLSFGTHVGSGQTAPATVMLEPTPPMNCGSGVRPTGLRFICDPGFSGAASVTATASSSAGTGATSLRLVSSAAATVMPELQPLLWDSSRPDLAPAADGTLTVAQQTGLGLQLATLGPDGGVSAYQPVVAQQLVLARNGQRLQQASSRTLSFSGRAPVRQDSMGPIAAAVDTDGTVWVATGALRNALVHLGASSSGAAETTFTAREDGLADAGTPIDLALSARGGAVALASVEIPGGTLTPGVDGTVVVRGFSGGRWTALPGVPSPSVVGLPADSMGLRNERVVALVHDAMSRPVLAFIGTDGAVHVLRLENGAWVALSGVSVGAGRMALSVSLAADATGRVVIAWHEATHVLPWSSGKHVQPAPVASSVVGWARLDTGGFVALPNPALDAEQGTFEQPFVTIDAQGRAAIAFIEDGRVVVRTRAF